ncbi:hypothetical protein BKA63DRAFT_169282 [Paraphoma chrysanthemicola]|nr:hypothetical protein BKA63DRAFT_169282 [Paraphoma chrysanthemicola]
MATEPQIALITGANRGIGSELARTLARDHNFHVILGSRLPELGSVAAADLQREGLAASFVTLDLSSDDSTPTAIMTIEQSCGHIDVLVNNAGVMLQTGQGDHLTIRRQAFQDSFNINITGSALLTDACIPLLSKSSVPRILFMSSTLGSITTRLDSGNIWDFMNFVPYRSSKAALNMIAAHYANRYKEQGWKVVTVCPGYVKTRMVGFDGDLTTEERCRTLSKCVRLGRMEKQERLHAWTERCLGEVFMNRCNV